MRRRIARVPKPETYRQPEVELRRQVLGFARLRQWIAYFTWTSVNSPPGFPDLVLVRRGVVVFAELKSEAGKLSDHQRRWLWDLAAAGAKVYVWKPSTWAQIEAVLV